MSRCIVLSLALFVVASAASLAQVPELISFQGRLDSLGVPLDSNGVGMTFSLYSGSSVIWSETQSVDVVDGHFDVHLGSIAPLDSVTFYGDIDLGVKLDGEPAEISPRTSLESAPFALGMRGMFARWAKNSSGSQGSGYNIVAGSHHVIGAGTVGATIGGGRADTVSADFGTVGGGYTNTVDGPTGTVSGGSYNSAGGHGAFVGGGIYNHAEGTRATVTGGQNNRVLGSFSTISGGWSNRAEGDYSYAGGSRAHANHRGTFVWQDATGYELNNILTTGVDNQFVARASGGFWFFTDPAPSVATGVYVGAGSGTWNTLSSRDSKSDLSLVDTRDYLERLSAIEMNEWSYKSEAGVTHVGPIAEDFYAAFGLGPSDKSISTVDADGVALAAIQGLYELVKEQRAEIEQLKKLIEEQ